jgi:tetrahydromethanopterin S-methyltransferase subunit A
MIQNIYGSNGIKVVGNQPAMPYINMINMSAGLVRYNGNISSLEVYDGNSWLSLNTSVGASIELDESVTEIIQWAKQKKDEEVELEKLAISNAAIRDLVYDLNETKNKIKMVQILLKENESVGTN